MYKAFYRFRETPFSPEPDPDFLYLSDTYETALAVLANGLANGVGVNVVLGETGTGKTTFIEYLLKHSPPDSAVASIREVVDLPSKLVKLILNSFGQTCKGPKPEACNRQLVDFLRGVRTQQADLPLLIIDDAHALNAETLKWISKLCAIDADTSPLLQLVLVGRKRLLNSLKKPELKQFSRKIGAICYLKPLTAAETKNYIYYRLETAGAANNALFDEESCLTVYGYSKGNPKVINELCQDALISGGAQRVDNIDSAFIHKVADSAWNSEPPPPEKRRSPMPRKIEVPWYKKVGKTTFLVGGVFLGAVLAMMINPAKYFAAQDPSQTTSDNVPENDSGGPKAIDRVAARAAKSDQALLVETPSSSAPESQPEGVQQDSRESLFDEAESHLQALRLTSPKGNNAHEIYQSILDRDPDNRAAQKGIERIVVQYQQLAENEITQGQYGKARDYLQNALALRPESVEIQESLRQVFQRRENIGRADNSVEPGKNDPLEARITIEEDRVEKLIGLAQQQIEAEKFLSPEADNAYETYSTILSIAPREERALAGLEGIAGRYLELAQAERGNGDLEKSQQFIQRGLEVRPGHPELSQLDGQVAVEIKRRSQENAIDQLVNRSEQQVVALKLTRPPGDNAYETYREIFAIDKNNQRAAEGLSEIQRRLTTNLEGAIKDEDFKSALDVAEQILAIPSEDAEDSYRMEAIAAAVDAKKYIKSQLESLLREAESQFDAQQLTNPPGRNAFDTYQRVLRLYPANESAQQGLERIAREYEVIVKAKLSEDDHRQALNWVKEGLSAFPDDAVLSSLQVDVKLRREEVYNDTKSVVDEKRTQEENAKKRMGTFGTF